MVKAQEPEERFAKMTLKGGHSLQDLERIPSRIVHRLMELSISTAEELVAQWYSQGTQLASAIDVPTAELEGAVAEAERNVDPEFLNNVRAFRPKDRRYGARNPYSPEVSDIRSRRRHK